VRLRSLGEWNGHDDYVNASWLSVPGCAHRMLAAQGPLPATAGHFWQGVLEEDCPAIVMVTREREQNRVCR
jgi:protein tyrosine phosphatase